MFTFLNYHENFKTYREIVLDIKFTLRLYICRLFSVQNNILKHMFKMCADFHVPINYVCTV